MHRVVWLARPLVFGAIVFGDLVFGGNAARAQSRGGAEETIRFAYDAPESCPSATELEARARRASPHVRVVAGEPDVRLFAVHIDGSSDVWRGRLSITKGDVPLGARDVAGASCEEVASVLAFAVALAVDPNAVPPEAPSAAQPAIATNDAPSIATPSAQTPPTTSAARTEWGLAAHLSGAPGLAPSTTFGGGISTEVTRPIGALVPALRLGLEYGTTAPVSSDGAKVTFADALVLLDVCPTTFTFGRFALRPCVRVDGGARITASEDIPGAHSVTRPWLDVGPVIQLRARVADPLFVAVEGGPLVPLLRDHVYFSPEITVHDVPAIAAKGEIVLGLAFR